MNPAVFRRCIGVALLLATGAAPAQPAAFAERYGSVPASADGIGKHYMGREISTVMGWQGAAWLERARDLVRGVDSLGRRMQERAAGDRSNQQQAGNQAGHRRGEDA